MHRARPIAQWLACVLLNACAIYALHRIGTDLALPDWSVSAWSAWFNSADASTIVFTFVRSLCLLTLWYLLITVVASAAVQVTRWSSAIVIVDALSLPAVRRLGRAAAGAALAGSLALPSPVHAQAAASDVPVLRHVGSKAVTAVEPETRPEAPSPQAAQRIVETEVNAPTSYTVKPGDNLWLISQVAVAQATGVEPDDASLFAYWRSVIELNKANLPSPDLILPGQVLQLPVVAK